MSKFNELYSKEYLPDISFTLINIKVGEKEPYCLTDDNAPHTKNGLTYLPYHYRLNLPDSNQNSVNQGSIVFSNVSNDIIKYVRENPRDIKLKIDVMYSTSGDYFEFPSTVFSLSNIVVNQTTVSADLLIDTILHDNIPSHKMSVINCPGIV